MVGHSEQQTESATPADLVERIADIGAKLNDAGNHIEQILDAVRDMVRENRELRDTNQRLHDRFAHQLRTQEGSTD